MKRKQRELSIFSVAAIDLFASGMGAFMLLALIAIPFFGNLSTNPIEACPIVEECPQCPEIVEAPKCPVVPNVTQQQIVKPQEVKPESLKKIEAIDVVFVLDISGSMRSELEQLKGELLGISMMLNRLSESAAIGIVVFGDDGFAKPATSIPLIHSSKIDTLTRQFGHVEINMGMGAGDNNRDGEAVLAGLDMAHDINWRPKIKKRLVLLITDDLPHSNQTAFLTNKVAQFYKGKDRELSVLFSGSDADIEFYKKLVKKGDGQVFELVSGVSFSAMLVLALLK